MENQEQPTPIGKGKIIRYEHGFNRASKIFREAHELFDRIEEMRQGIQLLLDKELGKPVNEQNLKEIIRLSDQLSKFETWGNTLIDISNEAQEGKETLREKIFEIEQRIEEKGY